VEKKFHIPVMLNEALDYLNLGPGKIVVDATVGTGGHSEEIVKRILPGGQLICIDRDGESLEIAKSRLTPWKESCTFEHGNFAQLPDILEKLNIEKVDAVLFDLGLSSYQLEDAQRGFSFQNEGPLDMRMDRDSFISAYDLVNNLNEEEISSMLWNFGQERWHNRIAHLLVQERQRQPIATTSQLANIVVRAIPSRFRYAHYRLHPATRTFQAVRIAVNRELEILDVAIDKAVEKLNQDGRICVISFHSLEDRIVKFNFRRHSLQNELVIITPKPLVPTSSEAGKNPSSRSAKLRVAQRISNEA